MHLCSQVGSEVESGELRQGGVPAWLAVQRGWGTQAWPESEPTPLFSSGPSTCPFLSGTAVHAQECAIPRHPEQGLHPALTWESSDLGWLSELLCLFFHP